MQSIDQNGLTIGDYADHNILAQLSSSSFLCSDEAGALYQVTGVNFLKHLDTIDGTTITSLHATKTHVYIATQHSLFEFPAKRQLDTLESRELFSLNNKPKITCIQAINDQDLLIGYEDGKVTQFVENSESDLIVFKDVICNLQILNDEVILVNTIGGMCALLERSGKLLNSFILDQSSRGSNIQQVLAPHSCLLDQYLFACYQNKLDCRIVTDPATIIFDIDVQNAISVRSVGKYLVCNSKQGFCVCQLANNGFELVQEIAVDKSQQICDFKPFINAQKKLSIYYIFINKNDQFKYIQIIKTDINAEISKQVVQQKTTLQQSPKAKPEIVAPPVDNDKSDDNLSDLLHSEENKQIQKKQDDVRFIDENNLSDSESEPEPTQKQTVQQVDVDESSDDIDQNKIIQQIMSKLNITEGQTAKQNTFYCNNTIMNQVSNKFTNQQDLITQLQQSAKSILTINKYGQANFQKSQNNSVQFIFANSEFQTKTIQSKQQIISGDIKESSYCYLSTDQLVVTDCRSEQNQWKCTFSSIFKPIKCILGCYKYCAVLFDNYQLILYNQGLVLMQLQLSNLLNISAFNNLFLLVSKQELQILDLESIKIAFASPVSLNKVEYCEILSTGHCVLQSENIIYMVNYLSSVDCSNIQLSVIHNQIEENQIQILQLQEKLIKVLKGDSQEQLQRKELELLIPSYKYCLYADVTKDNELLIYYFVVSQQNTQLANTYNILYKQTFNNKLQQQKIDYQKLFQQDIVNLHSIFPVLKTPKIPLLSLPELQSFKPSPPINQNKDTLDKLERKLFVNILLLNTQLTYQFDNQQQILLFQQQFDKQTLQYATECLTKGLVQRAMAASRLFRTRAALEGFRGVSNAAQQQQLSDYLMDLINDNYQDDELKTQLDIQILNSNITQLSQELNNVYTKRIDEMAFTFQSGNARERFNNLEKTLYAQVNDFIKQKDSYIQNIRISSKQTPQILQKSAIDTQQITYNQEEINLPEAKSDGMKKFKQILTGSKIAEEEVKTTIKVGNATTSPTKAGLQLSQLLKK